MSEETNTELDALKQRADLLGIQYHPNSKEDSLKAKINEHLANNSSVPQASNNEQVETNSNTAGTDNTETVVVEETRTQKRRRIKFEATKLCRVRVTPMDPQLASYKCLLFTTGNSATGTIKRYVQFNDITHVEAMILEQMREMRFQTFYEVPGSRGRKIKRSKLVPTYAIEELPALTEEQLHDLAQRQAMAQGTAEA